jgi:hypothetical protein
MLNTAIGMSIGILTIKYFFPTYILVKLLCGMLIWVFREEFESENRWTDTPLETSYREWAYERIRGDNSYCFNLRTSALF